MNWLEMVEAFNAIRPLRFNAALGVIALWAVVFAIKWWPRKGARKEG